MSSSIDPISNILQCKHMWCASPSSIMGELWIISTYRGYIFPGLLVGLANIYWSRTRKSLGGNKNEELWIFFIFSICLIAITVTSVTTIISAHVFFLAWKSIEQLHLKIYIIIQTWVRLLFHNADAFLRLRTSWSVMWNNWQSSLVGFILCGMIGIIFRSIKLTAPLGSALVFTMLFIFSICRIYIAKHETDFHPL